MSETSDKAAPAYTRVILDHYGKEAREYGTDASSTMRDEITRGSEIAAVLRTLAWLESKGANVGSILDVGCGNGYLLEVLRKNRPSAALTGLEYTPDMVALARQRNVERLNVVQGDVRELPFDAGTFDVVVTERCIINVMDVEHQARSLHEVARVLKRGGHFLCIEAFQDSLDELNAARAELGLPPNEVPYHNIWFRKAWFAETVAPVFEVVDLAAQGDPALPTPDFLSSHYFMSRAVYPAITKREVLYNTHFVKFFAAQFSRLPPVGSYAPIQFHLLRKR
jgi:ubiquinone/menaquinone biosynthesis C-methylase UbiE